MTLEEFLSTRPEAQYKTPQLEAVTEKVGDDYYLRTTAILAPGSGDATASNQLTQISVESDSLIYLQNIYDRLYSILVELNTLRIDGIKVSWASSPIASGNNLSLSAGQFFGGGVNISTGALLTLKDLQVYTGGGNVGVLTGAEQVFLSGLPGSQALSYYAFQQITGARTIKNTSGAQCMFFWGVAAV